MARGIFFFLFDIFKNNNQDRCLDFFFSFLKSNFCLLVLSNFMFFHVYGFFFFRKMKEAVDLQRSAMVYILFLSGWLTFHS